MQQIYDPRLVILSIVVAIGAAYTALSLAERVNHSRGRNTGWWLGGGAVALGIGIWSMHFIGMLALSLPIPLVYQPGATFVSLAAAIGISGLAMQGVNAQRLTRRRLLLGTLAMGTGISLMHYIGMAAIEVAPGIRYDLPIVGASVLLAMGASSAALLIAHRLNRSSTRHPGLARLAPAVVMGLAISGMHFTGMLAAHFAPDAICIAPSGGVDRLWLATSIGVGTVGVMAIAVLAALFDAHMSSRTQRLNRSLQQANLELEHQATHDALTGLPNRLLLADRIERAATDGATTGEHFAVAFIDLDRFKAVNDSLGHHVGDALLVEVARRIASCLQANDTLARFGGDEFVALLRQLPSPASAANFGSRVRAALAQPVLIEERPIHVSSTVGIAVFPDDGRGAEALIVAADAAMYHGKQSGRNAFHFFSPGMNQFAQQRFEIENGLRLALQRGELEVYYQPKVSVRSRRVVSVEALVRWNHPTRGLVPPDAFIPIAEETGLIDQLGEWVLHEACRQSKAWQQAGLPPLRVSVNLSAHQLRQADLGARVRRILAETGLEARYLELELTESAVMADPEYSISVLTALTEQGVQVAIDDFGTGYSSLSYLKRLPLSKLKVDRSFIRELATSPDDAAIVKAVIGLAHNLRLQVVAEGVETAEQLALLNGLQCDEFQGYFFSPPVRAELAARLIGEPLAPSRPAHERSLATTPDEARAQLA